MCGIVGVLGDHEVAPILVEALKRLEYRGYDSAGIATVNGGRLDRRRAVGKLVNLSDLLVHDPLPGKLKPTLVILIAPPAVAFLASTSPTYSSAL